MKCVTQVLTEIVLLWSWLSRASSAAYAEKHPGQPLVTTSGKIQLAAEGKQESFPLSSQVLGNTTNNVRNPTAHRINQDLAGHKWQENKDFIHFFP